MFCIQFNIHITGSTTINYYNSQGATGFPGEIGLKGIPGDDGATGVPVSWTCVSLCLWL